MKLIIRIETPIKINGEQLETGQATVLNYGFKKHLILKGDNQYLIESKVYDHLIKTKKICVV